MPDGRELPSYDRVKAAVIMWGRTGSPITIAAIARQFKITNIEAAKFMTRLEEDKIVSRWSKAFNGRRLIAKEGVPDVLLPELSGDV